MKYKTIKFAFSLYLLCFNISIFAYTYTVENCVPHDLKLQSSIGNNGTIINAPDLIGAAIMNGKSIARCDNTNQITITATSGPKSVFDGQFYYSVYGLSKYGTCGISFSNKNSPYSVTIINPIPGTGDLQCKFNNDTNTLTFFCTGYPDYDGCPNPRESMMENH